jgi:hypothetical protein
MKTLIFASCLAIASAFVVLYKIGTPCNGYYEAVALLPFAAFLVASVPIVLLPTKFVDSSDKRVVATACTLMVLMPFVLWQFGNPMLVSIGSIGSP